MIELTLMLLPVAAASGWYFASKHYAGSSVKSSLDHASYFQGLNYLVNNQSDKAIDVFVNLLEVDDESIDVHLALGTLFRKRGEVEKAIRLHQNLIARPELSQKARLGILNELGMDYMHAGLLDRAEALFIELEKHHEYRLNCTKQLLSIYQQEKEWDNAIDYGIKLDSINAASQQILLAHLYCERALQARDEGDLKGAKNLLKKALKVDSLCIRSNLTNAQFALRESKYKAALDYLLNIKQQNIQFVPVFLDMYLQCYDELNKPKEKFNFLATAEAEVESPIITKAFVSVLAEQKGSENAYVFIKNKLEQKPSMANLLLFSDLSLAKEDSSNAVLFYKSLSSLNYAKLLFHCDKCGFDSEKLNWMCPSCKAWGAIQPVGFLDSKLWL